MHAPSYNEAAIGLVDSAGTSTSMLQHAAAGDNLRSLHNASNANATPAARGWGLRSYALRALALQAAPHVCLEQLAQLRARAQLQLDYWCSTAQAVLSAEYLPAGPALDNLRWAHWMGTASAVSPLDGTSRGVTVKDALQPLLIPLLELTGWRLARINESHVTFAHLPSFESRSLLALHGDHFTPRKRHATPWLDLAGLCANCSNAHMRLFAGSTLGKSAAFLLYALARSEPPLFAFELEARILRVEAPLDSARRAARGERVHASTWVQLAALYCDAVRQLQAPMSVTPDQSKSRGVTPGPAQPLGAASTARVDISSTGSSHPGAEDALRVLGPLAGSWCNEVGPAAAISEAVSLHT